MKRIIFVAIILLLLSVPILADATSATTSMLVSAYKENPMPELQYELRVSYQGNETISGIAKIFDVSDKITNENTLWKVGNAFQININSSYKAAIPITVTFTPFINQKDKESSIPVTYTMRQSNSYRTTTDYTYTAYYSRYYYRYYPSVTLQDSSGTSVSQITVIQQSTATLTQAIASIERSSYSNRNYKSGYSMPSTTGNTIPGITNNPSSVVYFDLEISQSDYMAMDANVDYIATITFEVTTI